MGTPDERLGGNRSESDPKPNDVVAVFDLRRGQFLPIAVLGSIALVATSYDAYLSSLLPRFDFTTSVAGPIIILLALVTFYVLLRYSSNRVEFHQEFVRASRGFGPPDVIPYSRLVLQGKLEMGGRANRCYLSDRAWADDPKTSLKKPYMVVDMRTKALNELHMSLYEWLGSKTGQRASA